MPRRIGSTSYDENFPGSDITPEEWEFIQAVRAYQLRFGRRYPSWREVLNVARALGYRKVAKAVDVRHPVALTEPTAEMVAQAERGPPLESEAMERG